MQSDDNDTERENDDEREDECKNTVITKKGKEKFAVTGKVKRRRTNDQKKKKKK
jgi:hypothetical protein